MKKLNVLLFFILFSKSYVFASKPCSVNFLWLPEDVDLEAKLLFISKNADNQYFKNISEWGEKNRNCRLKVWFDSNLNSPLAAKNTIEEIKKINQNLALEIADIRDIPIVKENPEVFQDCFSLYFRIDLLKSIINQHNVEELKNDHSLFSDANVKGHSIDHELLVGNSLQLFNRLGYAFSNYHNERHENKVFILGNNTETLIAHKKFLINVAIEIAKRSINYEIIGNDENVFQQISNFSKFLLEQKGVLHLKEYNVALKPCNFDQFPKVNKEVYLSIKTILDELYNIYAPNASIGKTRDISFLKYDYFLNTDSDILKFLMKQSDFTKINYSWLIPQFKIDLPDISKDYRSNKRCGPNGTTLKILR